MPRKHDPRRACLKLHEWPAAVREAWLAAIAARSVMLGPHPYARSLDADSVDKAREGMGRYLGFLRHTAQLDPGAHPAELATAERLNDYFHELLELHNADYTVYGRFQELQMALRITDPDGEHRWITNPNGLSLRFQLPMEKRSFTLHHPADLCLWGVELMDGALALNGPDRRRVQFRDGLLIAMEALRGLRLRTVLSLKLGISIWRDDDTGRWHLDVPPEDVKNEKYIETRLPAILDQWVDRYVNVERRELLEGNHSDAFWINWGGKPLRSQGLDKRIRWWSGKKFGPAEAFGTHRFRHCIASTAPLLIPEHPGLGASMLRITHKVFREHYDRSEDVLAFREFNKVVDEERRRDAPLVRDLFDQGDTGDAQTPRPESRPSGGQRAARRRGRGEAAAQPCLL